MDKSTAIKAINAGAIAACISGVLTLLISLLAIGTDSTDETLGYWNDPFIFIDIGLIFVLAFFIWRKSRIAAVLMFLYFAASKLIISAETGQFTGIFAGLLFLWFFGRAVWGAFVWHKLEKAENPDYRSSKTWLKVFGGIVATVIILFLGFAIALSSNFTPATAVQTGSELPQKQLETLRDKDLIQPGESVEYYYFTGLFKVTAGGTIMTNERIIGFWNEDGEIQSLAYSLDDIDRMIVAEPGGAIADAVYQIAERGNDTESLLFALSVEDDRHLEMIEALEKRMAVNVNRESKTEE